MKSTLSIRAPMVAAWRVLFQKMLQYAISFFSPSPSLD